MAEIRVMLKFDYPPPTGPESRHMWMLLNPDHLRTVTDLSDLIRGRYYPNLRGALCLYVHDCLLPPGESARLVRDNDLIRVQWRGFDPEDDDIDGSAHPTKKRSRQRCEEDDAGERPATGAKKRKCETPRGREECEEEEEPPKSSRRKAKKKKKVLEEGAQEEFPEESSKRSKHKKRPEDSASLKALEKIMTLLGPNQGPSTKRGRGSSSSHQEPSEVSIQPIPTIPSPMTLRLFAALSGANVGTLSIDDPSGVSLEPATPLSAKKPSEKSGKPPTPLSEIPPKPGNKSNNDPPGRSADHTSSGDSESSTDQRSSTNPKRIHKSGTVKKTKPTKSSRHDSSESSSDEESTKPKGPPKRIHKSGTVKKTKPNHDLLAKKSTRSSSGSSSDEESTKPKEPPKVHTKAKPNPKLLTEGATKSSLADSSSDEESTAKPKEPPKGHTKAGTVSSVKTNPSHGPPAKKSTGSSSGSSSDEESTKPKEPLKVHTKTGTLVNKTKPNPKPLTEGATKSSRHDSSDSSSGEESTKPKGPPEGHNKAGTVKTTKPNLDLPAKKFTRSSSESSSDEESSSKGPPKGHNKVGTVAAVNKTNPNIGPSTTSTGSSIDHTASSYDQENQSEAPRNPSDSVPGRTVSSSEMRKSNNDSDSDNREFRRRMYGGTAPPLNGTSQRPHKDAPSSDSDTNQEPGTAQYPSRGAPSGVTNGVLHRGPGPTPNLYDQGRGRGRGIVPWRGQGARGPRGWGDRGKGRGGGHQFFHNYDSPSLKKQQLEEDATNTSMVIQNPPESPKKDYSAFPLLAGPPQVGKIIAFKILELDENYSPELSDYKEGVVRSVDPVTQQVELELLAKQKRREPGKFDLVYEMEDGREIVEFAVRPDRKMKEAWSSLITPRLVMDKEFDKGTPAQTM